MSKIVERVFQLTTPSGADLYGDIRWKRNGPEELDATRPVIIVCHGFKAFKDWGPFPAIGRFFAEAGFVSIVFNFSHNGIGKDFLKFSEQKKFSINSFKIELEDVETILTAVASDELNCPVINQSMIGIVGHSRGGGIAIIKAHEDGRIKAVAGWSTVAYFNRYTDGQRKRWREKGFIDLPSVNPLSNFQLSTALLDDMEQHKDRLNILRAVEQLHKPLLLIHGTADLPVPFEEGKNLYDISDRTMTEFIVLEGVGHMYGARHPYKRESPTMIRVLELTSSWFHKHL
jgi:dipeptidyl aminopeptidase/acylaminoacyl peptidase